MGVKGLVSWVRQLPVADGEIVGTTVPAGGALYLDLNGAVHESIRDILERNSAVALDGLENDVCGRDLQKATGAGCEGPIDVDSCERVAKQKCNSK